jgi:hypothetical protein
MTVQNVDLREERKLSLLGSVGVAQTFLGVDFVLMIKRELYGDQKLNDLEVHQLNNLLSKLRVEFNKKRRRDESASR